MPVREGGRVVVETRTVDDGIEIRVSDNGYGIAPAIRDTNLRPVLHHQASRQRDGAGPVDQLRHYQGPRRVDRFRVAPGQGTQFTIVIPIAPLDSRGRARRRLSFSDSILKRVKQKGAGFAVCINNENYPASLECTKIDRVLPDVDAAKDGDMRIVDESGEDYLYPAKGFIIIDVPEQVRFSLLGPS